MTQNISDQKRDGGVLSGVTRDDEELMQEDPEAMDSQYSGYEADGSKRRYYTPGEGRAHLSALFAGRIAAEAAVQRLEMLGVPHADISLVVREETAPSNNLSDDLSVGAQHPHTRAGEAAGSGSIIGGTVGAVLGAIAAAATAIALPGIGIIIAGPIAGALAGAGAGSLTGGLVGALVGAGIPEETARTYEQGVHGGGVLVVADVPAHLAPQAQQILTP